MSSYLPVELSQLHPDPRTAPFWEAARQHQLVASKCAACGDYQPMPPNPVCWECQSENFEWVEIGEEATVYTFTVVRQSLMPALDTVVPYVIAVVEFDGLSGMRLITNIVEVDVDDVAVGMPVRVVWDDVDGATIPRFAPLLAE